MRIERNIFGSANLGLLIGIFHSGIVTKSWISSVQGTTSAILFCCLSRFESQKIWAINERSRLKNRGDAQGNIL